MRPSNVNVYLKIILFLPKSLDKILSPHIQEIVSHLNDELPPDIYSTFMTMSKKNLSFIPNRFHLKFVHYEYLQVGLDPFLKNVSQSMNNTP